MLVIIIELKCTIQSKLEFGRRINYPCFPVEMLDYISSSSGVRYLNCPRLEAQMNLTLNLIRIKVSANKSGGFCVRQLRSLRNS